ncbi:MAG: hypothetical protein E7473_03550 [Ruminococcaceae bacterium]|nr:hypothetical protein [Oscillospiraceae bacterium]
MLFCVISEAEVFSEVQTESVISSSGAGSAALANTTATATIIIIAAKSMMSKGAVFGDFFSYLPSKGDPA